MDLNAVNLWIILALLIGFFLLGVLVGALFEREKYVRHRYEFSFSLKELSTLINLSLPLIESIWEKIYTSPQLNCKNSQKEETSIKNKGQGELKNGKES